MSRECMICLEETTDFVVFSCKHEVCFLCFPKVLATKPECPLCSVSVYAPPCVYPVAPHIVRPVPQRNYCPLFCGIALLLGYATFMMERYIFK